LCLLAGVPAESILHYQTSIELLRSVSDSLWLAGIHFQSFTFNHATVASRKLSVSVKANSLLISLQALSFKRPLLSVNVDV